MTHRRRTLALLSLALCLLLPHQPARSAERPPNVIFILTDDQGFGDAAFAGHPHVKTPHLDRLAREGTWLQQFYVAATVCSPSRTAFMTAHAPARHRIHGHLSSTAQNTARSMPDWLDPQVTTLPRLLKTAGYATAHFGKWHLGSGPGAPAPEAYGFDTSKTVNSNGAPLGDEAAEPYFRARSTQLIIDETLAFIRAHRDQPFYINAWTLLPHALLKPTPEQLAVYADLSPSAHEASYGPWMKDYLASAKNLRSQMQVFCASLTDLDTQIGRLLDGLDELQLTQDTLLFFTSDNGPEDYRVSNAANAGTGSTGPLRARKRSMYEGGIRPLGLVRWPGKVPAGRIDRTSVTSAVDFLPTLCKLARVPLPPDLKPDGEDVSDIWLGAERPRATPLHWEWLFSVQGADDGFMPPPLAIREGPWKLFTDHQGRHPQLYHIPDDPGEHTDLAAQKPDLVRDLTAKALAWVTTLPPSPARDTVRQTGQPVERSQAKGKGQATAKATTPTKTLTLAQLTATFQRWDKDQDGSLTLQEYTTGLGDKPDATTRFNRFDQNTDQRVTLAEFLDR